MDARAKTVGEILQTGKNQYLVPFFQRHYKWRTRHWRRLWDDLMGLLERGPKDQHFLGSLVCTPHDPMPGELSRYLMIDGQQRVTTLVILLAALRNSAKSHQLDGLAEQITEDLLIYKRHAGSNRYRLVPRLGDREVLAAVVEGELAKKHRGTGIELALRFFERAIEKYVETANDAAAALKTLLVALTDRLLLVAITINDENPYEIFWSLNDKGLPLEQSDLIRNFMFMQVPLQEQEDFNGHHWQPLEELLGDTGKKKAARSATRFYRNYIMRNGQYSRKEDTFSDFQRDFTTAGLPAADMTRQIARFATYHSQMTRPHTVEDKELSRALWHIELLDMTTAHPLIMCLLDLHERRELGREDLLRCLRHLASFVLRRSICGESTRAYSRWFVEAIKALGDSPAHNLEKFLLDKQWPDDEAFLKRLADFELYRRERRKAELILKELEARSGHKEPVAQDKLTIEHVLPQTLPSGAKGNSWREVLGDNAKDVHRRYVHTLGNLTLTGYNPELSNAPYEKKSLEYAKSHLELNKYFAQCSQWTPAEIRQRGEVLANQVAMLWPRPEGQAYIPLAQGTEAEQEFHTTYWSSLLERLTNGTEFELGSQNLGRHWIELRTTRRGFRYFLEANTENNELTVGVLKHGRNQKRFIEALWIDIPDTEVEQHEKSMGGTFDWNSDDDPDSLDEIAVFRDAEIGDRSDWPDQHDWLIRVYRELKSWIDPYIQAVDPNAYDWEEDESETSASSMVGDQS